MLRRALLSVCLGAACASARARGGAVSDPRTRGNAFISTHSSLTPVDKPQFDDPDVKEWHFHVYWNVPTQQPGSNDSYVAALRVHQELLAAVAAKEFVAIFSGVNESMVPGLDTSHIPHINEQPIGPHPCGSFEVWAPYEYYVDVMSFFLRRRGELTILIHPLTPHELEDHTGRAMWLGPPYRLNLAALGVPAEDEPQYPELGLGYSAGRA